MASRFVAATSPPTPMKIVRGLITGFSFVFVSFSLAGNAEPADVADYKSRLGFENVPAFKSAREGLSALGDGVGALGGFLQDKALDLDAKREVERELPKVMEAMNANPAQCALVYVRIDSQSNGTATQYSVRDARLMGVGDSAVQAIAPVLFQNSKTGTFDKGPKAGFVLDANKSHLLCFGMRDGKLTESVVWMGTAKSSIAEAVEKLKKEDEAAAESRKSSRQKKKPSTNPAREPGMTSDRHDIMADRMRERADRAEKTTAEKAQTERGQKEKASADKAQSDKQRADRDKKTPEPREKPKPEPKPPREPMPTRERVLGPA